MDFKKEELAKAVLHLFKSYKDIKIHANKYNNDSIKILSYFGKKYRQNDVRNQKLLYKMWNDEHIQKEVQEMFERRENTVEDDAVSSNEDEIENNMPEEFIVDELVEEAQTNENDAQISHLHASINELTCKIAAFENSERSCREQLQSLAHQNEELLSDIKRQRDDQDKEQLETKRTEDLQLMSITRKNQEIERLNTRIQELEEKSIVGPLIVAERSLVLDLEKEIQRWIENSTAAETRKIELEKELAHQEKINNETQTLTNELQSKLLKATEKIEILEKELNESRNNTDISLELSKPEIDKGMNVNQTNQLQLQIESLLESIATKDEELDKIKKTNVDVQDKLEISLKNGSDVQGKLSESEADLKNEMALSEPKWEQLPQKNEEIFRCICGIFTDDKENVQCQKCMVWQHKQCTGSTVTDSNYVCEKCDQREVDPEIALNEYTDEGYQYYLTLIRGELLIRKFDTVYVLPDMSISQESTSFPAKKHTYKTIQEINYNICDIFRIEHLWKDVDGNRFVFGHIYLRPNEIFHKPGKKFFKNEIVRIPRYEVLPIGMIMGRCWVLDSTTFCKGRPLDCEESHVYICDMKTDKARKTLSRIIQKHPICTKPYAFQTFDQKLAITRDFVPHHSTSAKKRKTMTIYI